MTEQTQQPNGAPPPSQDVAVVQAKADHAQAMERIRAENEMALARFEAELVASQPFAVRMYFDRNLFARMNEIAEMMMRSASMPDHIRGDQAACFECIERGWNWKQSPLAVARGTFKVGKNLGYFGRTIIGAINGSLRMQGALQFEHVEEGEKTWTGVTGVYEKRKSQKKTDEHGQPAEYLVPAYTPADEAGLAVIVRGKLVGDDAPREHKMYLRQCFPRNSTLWATDPKTQIMYTAARRFASLYMPEIISGTRDEDEVSDAGSGGMKDITPQQTPAAAAEHARDPLADIVAKAKTSDAEVVDPKTGEVTEAEPADKPKRGRRSYDQIVADVLADIASLETVEDSRDWNHRDYSKVPVDRRGEVDQALAAKLAELLEAAAEDTEDSPPPPEAHDPKVGAWLGNDLVEMFADAQLALDAVYAAMGRVRSRAEADALLEKNRLLIQKGKRQELPVVGDILDASAAIPETGSLV